MPQLCVSELGQHWFRLWLVAYSAPSHYLNQCWIIVKWIPRNKVQLNFNQNTKFSSTKMHPQISSVKWRPFCPGGLKQLLLIRILRCDPIYVLSDLKSIPCHITVMSVQKTNQSGEGGRGQKCLQTLWYNVKTFDKWVICFEWNFVRYLWNSTQNIWRIRHCAFQIQLL